MTNFSIIRAVVVLLSIFVTGLLAGVMLGVAMEQQTAQKLPEAAWTLRQQNDDALLRRVMPFTFVAMMLLLVASLFLLQGHSRIAMVAATVSALAVIIVTAGWEVPLNNQIVDWTPGSAPADWASTRDKWLHNHWVRT
jgi:Ca2+/Na+ antiporter